jgi:undecaprenol kinase/diacylglycerol kinase (ATP)
MNLADQPSAKNEESSTETVEVRRATFLKSFLYAGQGVWYVIITQRNMRVHLLAGAAVVVVGIILGISWAEWACLLGIMALVYTLEMLNTVVEAIVDMYTRQFHPLAKVAKDVAAGAVLVSAVFAVAIGLVIFLPRILHWIFK